MSICTRGTPFDLGHGVLIEHSFKEFSRSGRDGLSHTIESEMKDKVTVSKTEVLPASLQMYRCSPAARATSVAIEK